MDMTCNMHGLGEKIHRKFWTHRGIILQGIFKRNRTWTAFVWLRIESIGRLNNESTGSAEQPSATYKELLYGNRIHFLYYLLIYNI